MKLVPNTPFVRAGCLTVAIFIVFGILMHPFSTADADGPFNNPLPTSRIHEQITMILSFDLKEGGELSNIGGQIINSVPESYTGTPFMWTGRVTTFDNQCPYIFPLYHPRLISMDEFRVDQDLDFGGWYRTGSDVDFILSTPFYPTATEVEVFDTALHSRGIFDVDPLIASFCENNPDNLKCQERKNKFFEIFELEEAEKIPGSTIVDFDHFEHYDGWSGGFIEDENAGLKIYSSNSNGSSDGSVVVAIDMAKTDLDENYLNAGYSEENTKNIAVGLLGDYESYMVLHFAEPIGGVGMYLGLASEDDYDSKPGPTDVSSVVGEYQVGSVGFLSNFAKLNMKPKAVDPDSLTNDDTGLFSEIGKEAAVTLNDDVVALMRGFDEDGKLIGEIDTKLPPLPGIHQFWGFGAPYNSVSKVEVEYRSRDFTEFVDKFVIFPENFSKLLPRRTDIQNCFGLVPVYGSITLPPLLPPELPRPGAITPGTVTPGAVTPGAVTPGAVTPGTVTPTAQLTVGDIDASGALTIADIVIVLDSIVTSRSAADFAGTLEAIDVYPISPGECGDGIVNMYDALVLLQANEGKVDLEQCRH